jgi:hypothetical protein
VSRTPSPIRQRDIARAIRAAKASGLEVTRFEIDPSGKIIIWSKGQEGGERKTEPEGNPWDSVELPKRKKWSR